MPSSNTRKGKQGKQADVDCADDCADDASENFITTSDLESILKE